MSGSKSKNKGAAFEREIAKFLSDIYGASFVRASHSGAYVGGTNNHRKTFLSDNQIRSFKGDIIPPDNWTKFNAEAKFYADFAFHQLFDESKQLEDWIDQLMTASDPGDFNILIMKFNRRGRYVAVQAKTSIIYHQQQKTGDWIDINRMNYTTRVHGVWLIYPFESFFAQYKDVVALLSSENQTENSNQNRAGSTRTLTPSPTTL